MFFSSREKSGPEPFPAVPDSLRSESIEMTGIRKVPEPHADTAPYITPYLSLRARLSQVWINRWTVLLLLVLVRVVILVAQLHDDIGDAKAKALSACSDVEDIGSAMASMPHYLSVGVNDLAASGIDSAVHAMVDVLGLMLDGVEGLILFFINFMTATYVCLLTAMIHGSLDVVGAVTEDATDAFNDVVSKATAAINSTAGDLESAINDFVNGIDSSFLGDALPKIPKVDFSEPIDELTSFKLNSSDFVSSVQKLNNEIPSFSGVQNLTSEAISIPFNITRQAIDQAFGNYKFNQDVFPLAQKQQLTFCSNNDTLNNFFTDLFELVAKAKFAFIVVLIILAILAMIPFAWLEIRRWRKQRKYAKLISNNQYDSMDVIYIASRPLSASWGIRIASVFKGKRQILVRWCVAYATSTPAIFVLSLAAAGFFSCFCQFLLLKAIQKEVPALSQEVGNFADEVVQTLQNVSAEWAADANGVITNLNNDINDHVLNYVANATTAANNTLNTFLDEMNDGLNAAFNGTVLLDPIKTVINCVIGIKIESVEKGLTWVHDNAHVSLPLFDNNTFSLGANESVSGDSKLNTFLSTPTSVTTDQVSAAVKQVTDWLHNNIVQEALVSTGILMVYMIVILIGVIRTLSGMAMPDRGRAEGGIRYTGEDRPPMSPRSQQMWSNEPASAPDRYARSGPDPFEPEIYGANGTGSKRVNPPSYVARAQQVTPEHKRSSSYGHFDYAEKR